MRRVSIFVYVTVKWVCCGWLLVLGPMAWAQTAPAPGAATPAPLPDWIVASAPARFEVELDAATPATAITAVTLWLPEPGWADAPIRVFADNGVPVGSDLLWAAPGEPTTLLFDSSSGAKRYKIYLGSNWPALHLSHPQSGMIMESRAGNGKAIQSLDEMRQAWSQSSTVYGRDIVEGLFEGGHRFGSPGNVFEHFQGWFDVAVPEHLQLAIISNDAAFVLVDGKKVVEWPGQHDSRPGFQAQHQGGVELTPGPHLLECYNAFVLGNPVYHQLICCVEAKGGALAQWTMLMPSAGFFRPISRARVIDYQVGPSAPGTGGGTAPPFAIEWAGQRQSALGVDTPEVGLISVRLTCRPRPTGTVTWTFDDGTTAHGSSVEHLFPRPGLRKVRLAVKDGEKDLGTVEGTIRVHLNWMPPNSNPPQLISDHLTDLMSRDPATFSAADLASCAAVFETYKSTTGLLKFLPALCAKMKEMDEADLPYLLAAGLYLVQGDLLHFGEASRLLQALVERCTVDKPSPQLVRMGSEARLALAQITLETSSRTAEVKALLEGVNGPALIGDEPRALLILQADLALAGGDVEGAKKQYQKLTNDPSGPDARSSIRRTARIGQARVFLDRKDFESAAEALAEVAWQAPIEKMSPDWALTQLRLYQEQGPPVAAYLWVTRLLPVVTESERSELLFRLADLAFAQGHEEMAKQAVSELLQKHPYSEEAARAKEKWPGK